MKLDIIEQQYIFSMRIKQIQIYYYAITEDTHGSLKTIEYIDRKLIFLDIYVLQVVIIKS